MPAASCKATFNSTNISLSLAMLASSETFILATPILASKSFISAVSSILFIISPYAVFEKSVLDISCPDIPFVAHA